MKGSWLGVREGRVEAYEEIDGVVDEVCAHRHPEASAQDRPQRVERPDRDRPRQVRGEGTTIRRHRPRRTRERAPGRTGSTTGQSERQADAMPGSALEAGSPGRPLPRKEPARRRQGGPPPARSQRPLGQFDGGHDRTAVGQGDEHDEGQPAPDRRGEQSHRTRRALTEHACPEGVRGRGERSPGGRGGRSDRRRDEAPVPTSSAGRAVTARSYTAKAAKSDAKAPLITAAWRRRPRRPSRAASKKRRSGRTHSRGILFRSVEEGVPVAR